MRVLTLAVLMLAVAGCSQADAIRTPAGQPKMEAAKKEAQATLPRFWAKIDSGDPAIAGRLVKIGFPTSDGRGVEYLWVAVEAHNDKEVRGWVTNEPQAVSGLHEGQIVTADISRIVDWTYCKAGQCFGQFTTRALIETADEETARQFREGLAPTPLEPEVR